MKYNRTYQNDCARITLSGTVTIDTAEQLHQELIFALADSQGLVLDLSGVEECDVSTLQIFYAAWLAAKSDNKKFILETPSQVIVNTVRTAGLGHIDFFLKSAGDNGAELQC